MNRALVEAATHPAALEVLAARLTESDDRWKAAWDRSMGKDLAQGQAAEFAIINWRSPAADFRVADERIATRLGLGDIEIEFTSPLRGPFPGSELSSSSGVASGLNPSSFRPTGGCRKAGFSGSVTSRHGSSSGKSGARARSAASQSDALFGGSLNPLLMQATAPS